MSYVVLARKWRPKFFEEVVGQSHVARTLKNSIDQDRVAHSYLFTGARGVGKTSTARILAKALNCAQGPTQTPCYECSSCLEISQGQSVDVFEIDGASNRGINEIRELREGARYAPSKSRYKIYIIDEVHMLTTEAFNALLKTLEEPPPHVKFIFATTEPQKIPVTILSRCQRFDFKRIGQHDIVEHLLSICPNEGIEAEKEALQLIARQAAGGMRDALSLLDQVISFAGTSITEEQVTQILGVANRTHLFELSKAILAHDAQQALLTLDEVHRYGYDLQQFASEMVNHMRDLMVVKVVQHPERVTTMTQSEIDLVRGPLQSCTTDLLHRYFSVMIDGAQEMSRSPYPKLIFEMTLVRMCQLEPLISLDLLVDKLEALEGTLDDVEMAPITPSSSSSSSSSLAAPEQEAKKKTEVSHPAPPAAPAVTSAPRQAPDVEQVPERVEAPASPPTSAQPASAARAATSFQASAPDEVPDTPLDRAIDSAPKGSSEQPVSQAVAQPPSRPESDVTQESSQPVSQKDEAEPGDAQEEEPGEGEEERFAPAFDHLDEELERLAMEAEEEQDMLGLESEEHEPDSRQQGRYEIFSMSDAQRAPTVSLDPLVSEESEDAEEEEGSGGIPLPAVSLESEGRQATWKRIVDHIRTFQAPLAATLEHAYIEEFTGERISMTFIQRYSHFVHDDRRLALLKDLLGNVFGEGFETQIGTRFDDTPLPGFETLAQLRDLEMRQRRDTLADDTEHHPVVQKAHALFMPAASRIMVALHDD